MSCFLVLLALVATLLSSSVLSESQTPAFPQNSFLASSGSDLREVSHTAEPGGILEVDVSRVKFTSVCIVDTEANVTCEEADTLTAHLPEGTELVSTNPDVASVDNEAIEVNFHKPGATTLELRPIGGGVALASYRLIVHPVPPGTMCEDVNFEDLEIYVDCSGKCVEGIPPEEISSKCCETQFGDAPDFELCAQKAGTCSFNAKTDRGTCAEMCRQFGSVCVAALSNPQDGGCTPNTLEMDPNAHTHTCDTGAMTEICVCERRSEPIVVRSIERPD